MNLFSRVISATVGILLLAGVFQFFGVNGLALAVSLVLMGALIEFRRVAFATIGSPAAFQWLFVLASVGAFVSIMNPSSVVEVLGLGAVLTLFLTFGLWLMRGPYSNEQILRSYGVGLIGLIYCALFPGFALKLLFLEHGPVWFFSLLVIVFSGDTFAYFGGRFLGKRKLFEQISPKKTQEGALSATLGSSLVGAAYFYYFFPALPLAAVIPFCVLVSIAGQSGDLFMSLMKRVADVKDSGRVMPGHGGVLDRLDGVFMASPLIYIFSVICLYFFDL